MTGRQILALVVLVLIIVLVPQAAAGAPRPIRLLVNGREARPDVPPVLVNGRVLVPLRFVAEALGCEVEWDAASRTVEIRTRPWVSPAFGRLGSLLILPLACRQAEELAPSHNPLYASRARPGQVYLVVELVVANLGTSVRTINPQHLFRLDIDRREFEPDWEALAFSLERPLTGEVAAGELLQGEVAFAIPAGTRAAALRVRVSDREQVVFQLAVDGR